MGERQTGGANGSGLSTWAAAGQKSRSSSPPHLLPVLAGQAGGVVPGVGGDLVRLGSAQPGGDERQQLGFALVVGQLVGEWAAPSGVVRGAGLSGLPGSR
jgi:hypothetical protein